MSTEKRLPSPSAGWTSTAVRLLFGVILAIDAVLKWLPGYRNTYVSQLKTAAAGQPSWWRVIAEPHAVDRVSGAPLIEPVAVRHT